MNKTRLLVLGAALVISLLCARAAFKYMEKPEPGNMDVVVAAQDIAPGQELEISMVRVVAVPENDAPLGAMSDPGDVVGLKAVTWIRKSEPIKAGSLSNNLPKPKSSLAGRIEKGKRAISISVDAVSGLAGMVERGNLVDVIASSPVSDQGNVNVSRLLMENIRVLEINTREKADEKRAFFKGTATLSVTPAQAAVLAAAEDARIILALRFNEDSLEQSMETTQFSGETGPMTESQANSLAQGKLEQIQKCIRKGSRAVTISYTDEDGICGKLHPGDRVDIIATHTFFSVLAHGKKEAGEALTVKDVNLYSKTVMQNMEIMAIEADMVQGRNLSCEGCEPGADDEQSPNIVRGAATPQNLLVTLLTTPKDAEKLTVLAEASNIKMVLRNKGDEAQIHTQGQTSKTLFQQETYYEIDVYKGNTHGAERFESGKAKAMREKDSGDSSPDNNGVI